MPELSLVLGRPCPGLLKRSWRGRMDHGRAGHPAQSGPQRRASGTPGRHTLQLLSTRLPGRDTDLMPYKTLLENSFWRRRFGESHQTICRSARILEQFAKVTLRPKRKLCPKVLRLPGRGSGDLAGAKGGERDLSVTQRTTQQVQLVCERREWRRPPTTSAESGAGEGVLPEVTGGSRRWRVKRRSRPTSLSFTGSDVGPDGKYPPRTQKRTAAGCCTVQGGKAAWGQRAEPGEAVGCSQSGRRARATCARQVPFHPRGLSQAAGDRSVWPWSWTGGCGFSARLCAAELARKVALQLPGLGWPSRRPHDDNFSEWGLLWHQVLMQCSPRLGWGAEVNCGWRPGARVPIRGGGNFTGRRGGRSQASSTDL